MWSDRPENQPTFWHNRTRCLPTEHVALQSVIPQLTFSSRVLPHLKDGASSRTQKTVAKYAAYRELGHANSAVIATNSQPVDHWEDQDHKPQEFLFMNVFQCLIKYHSQTKADLCNFVPEVRVPGYCGFGWQKVSHQDNLIFVCQIVCIHLYFRKCFKSKVNIIILMTEDRVCRGDYYIMDIKVDVNASVWRLLVWETRTLLLVPQLSTVKMKSIRLLSVSTGRHLLSRRDVLAGSSGGRTIAVLVTTLTTPLGSHTAGKTEASGICWWHKKYLALFQMQNYTQTGYIIFRSDWSGHYDTEM